MNPVEQFLNDLQLADPERYEWVRLIRQAIYALAPDVSERVMYGGLMFSAPTPFCGVFAYSEHVSLEFVNGCELDDPHGVLEGKGKLRRHIKIRAAAEIAAKHLSEYLEQAYALSRRA